MLTLESLLQEIINDKYQHIHYFFESGTFIINTPPKPEKTSTILNVATKNTSKKNDIIIVTNNEIDTLYKELNSLWIERGNSCLAFILDDFIDWEWYIKEIRAMGYTCLVVVIGTFSKEKLKDTYELYEKKFCKESFLYEYPIGRYSGNKAIWYIDIETSLAFEMYNLRDSLNAEIEYCIKHYSGDFLSEILAFIRFKKGYIENQ